MNNESKHRNLIPIINPEWKEDPKDFSKFYVVWKDLDAQFASGNPKSTFAEWIKKIEQIEHP